MYNTQHTEYMRYSVYRETHCEVKLFHLHIFESIQELIGSLVVTKEESAFTS